jgi:hypothetical protein
MADDLADLGAPVEDRILVLIILRGLNERFEHVAPSFGATRHF